MRPLLALVFFIGMIAESGCAMLVPTTVTVADAVPTIAHFGYGTAVDQRSLGDMASDKDLALRLKQELMHLRAKDGFFLNIYVYQGRVFLVGDPPDDFREPVVRFAIRQEGLQSLDYCFFPHNSGSPVSDFMTQCSLRINLLFKPGISSSWVDTEVYAGQAVLMGIVEDEEDVLEITELARNTSGVSNIVNFLLVEGKPYTPPPDSETIPAG